MRTDRKEDLASLVPKGHAFYMGVLVAKDAKRAADCFTRAASNDNTDWETRMEARFMLAQMSGDGDPPNLPLRTIATLYAQVGRTDHERAPQSLLNLAQMYLNGYGIPQNGRKAIACLERIAKKGPEYLLEVATTLARIHLKGEGGVERNLDKALDWLEPALRAHDPEALFMAGELYRDGEGVQANLRMATNFIGIAAEYRYPPAKKELARLLARDPDIWGWHIKHSC